MDAIRVASDAAMNDHSNDVDRSVNRRRVLRAAGGVAIGTAGLAVPTSANELEPTTYINFCGCSAYCLCTTNGEGVPMTSSRATLYTVPAEPPNGSTYREEDVEATSIGNGCDEPGGKVVVICVDGHYYCNEAACATNPAGALAAVKDAEDFGDCDNDDPNAVVTNNEGGCGQPIGPCGDGGGGGGRPRNGPPNDRRGN